MIGKYQKICLPLRDPDGSTVHCTLNGEWLVGMHYMNATPSLGSRASDDEQERWGTAHWFVIRSASGKLVVYKRPILNLNSASVAIYDSVEAIEPHIPPSIYDELLIKAELKSPQTFREVPLEGV